MSTRKKLLPPGWILAQLGDVTEAKATQYNPNPPFTYIDISSINNTTKQIEQPKSLTAADRIPSRARQQLIADDVLVSMTRPNLNAVAKVPSHLHGAVGSTGFHVLRPVEVNPGWLFTYVRTHGFIDSLVARVQGAMYPAVRPDDIREQAVPLPPLLEQRRIVAKIESLQERSSRARAALAEVGPLLEQFRRSVLSAAFSGRLTADWRAANPDIEPASELLNRIRTQRRHRWEQAELAKYKAKSKKIPNNWKDRYKEPEPVDDSDLPELPNGWCWGASEEIVEPEADIVYGIVQPGKQIDGGIPYVRGKDIVEGRIQVDQLLRTSETIAKKYERASLKGGDILLGIIRATKVAVVPEEITGGNITQGTARFRPSSIIRTSYLAGWLDSPFAQNWLHDHYRGIDMPGLNLQDVRRLPVPVAPIAEQEVLELQVAKATASVVSAKGQVADSRSELAQLDQSILAKAFRGELVPQNPSDEPASELLARIRTTRQSQAPPQKNGKKAGSQSKNRAANA